MHKNAKTVQYILEKHPNRSWPLARGSTKIILRCVYFAMKTINSDKLEVDRPLWRKDDGHVNSCLRVGKHTCSFNILC